MKASQEKKSTTKTSAKSDGRTLRLVRIRTDVSAGGTGKKPTTSNSDKEKAV